MDSAGPPTSDARALAAELSARDDATLERLLAARGVGAGVPWRDFFDAAEALLEAGSIDRALTRLPRSSLAALAAGAGRAAGDDALEELALVRADGTAYRAVGERVAALGAEHPSAFGPSPAADPPRATELEEAAAAERAALSVASLADVLVAAPRAPRRARRRGMPRSAPRARPPLPPPTPWP
ncbi:MAG: hypothetical protein QM602_05510, partial [Microbacterium sp.]